MPDPIAHYGTFDVANFGDLLFPLILERRLGDLAPILHVSPKGGAAPIAGAVDSVGPDAVPRTLRGVVVGGGHLIRPSPTNLPDYGEPATLALSAYPSLWLGAAEKALVTGAPLVWNAPGLPERFSPRAAEVLAYATSFLDYASVRDDRSRELLRVAGCEVDVEVAPDTAIEVASLFGADELERAYHDAFSSRGIEPTRPSLALHLNARYLREEVPLVAARIARICARTQTLPILIALGPCHGDAELARQVAARLSGPLLVLDRANGLREIVACIARSEFYLGSSLHGAITACAFGRKAAIVAREGSDGGKFSAFLRSVGLDRWRFDDWEAAESAVIELATASAAPWQRVVRESTPLVEQHWTRLRDALQSSPRTDPRRARAQARRAALLDAVPREFGVQTLLLPYLAELTIDQSTRLADQQRHASALKASYRSAASALRRRIAELETSSAEGRSQENEISD